MPMSTLMNQQFFSCSTLDCPHNWWRSVSIMTCQMTLTSGPRPHERTNAPGFSTRHYEENWEITLLQNKQTRHKGEPSPGIEGKRKEEKTHTEATPWIQNNE